MNAKQRRKAERVKKHKAEKALRKELSRLDKSDPRVKESWEKTKFRNREERELQIRRLRKKLLGVGIVDYISGYKRFNEIAEQFIETGEDIDEDIHIEEMNAKVCLVVSLRIDKTKDCGITVKNLKVSQQTLDKLKGI